MPPAGGRPAKRRASLVATVVLLGGALTACAAGNEVSTSPKAIQAWVIGSQVGASLQTVRVDAENVGFVIVKHNSPSAVRTACALLATDAQTAIGQLPSPDLSLTTTLNNAYSEAATAGTECYNGRMAASAAARAKVLGLVRGALAQIETLTGHTPSTTTTLNPNDSGDPFAG